MKPIIQNESSECGLACLAMIASHFGQHTDLADLRRRFSVSLKGVTLAQLMRHANAMQMMARPLRLELDELPALALPCILHWNLNHFVVLKKIRKNWRGEVQLTLLDPAIGARRVTLREASAHFTGVALELIPNGDFIETKAPAQIRVRQLTGHVSGLRRALVQVFILTLALELFAIVAPLFNQFVLDEVIGSSDRELLRLLVVGFGLLLVTQTALSLARGWFLMRWSIDIGFQWTSRVLRHLVRLPVPFFEKRHLGDIVSRFGSIGAIQGTLTSLFVGSVLDGMMALLALVMMVLYSPVLTVITVAGLALYSLLRWAFYLPLREASQERLILSAKENSHFLETMRAITPLKLFGREAERLARWQNLKLNVINRDVNTQKLGILFDVTHTVISGAQGLTVFYIGAGLVMSHTLTIGMLFAYSSYSATFSGRIFSLIDLFVSIKMLSLHTQRLADIVLEPAEPETLLETDTSRLTADITLRNVKFRYADGEPWVLNGLNLHIPAGQSVALVGPSGCGKTTLCKIILGLLTPTEGEVLIGQVPIKQLGLRTYRSLVGTVMQDDVLLAGSIHDNISFFDANVDAELVQQAARMAAIHDDIIRMPMGYQSLVGDMGSSLSGGQKQRVLLARALYKQPKILALDEATSHLDLDNEERVNQALAALAITRIMVAHRPQTIAAAERVVSIADGRAVEEEGVSTVLAA